jgi:hypothetical protein
MNRFIVVLVALLLAAGCGGGEGETSSTEDHSGHDHTAGTTTGREAIPEAPPSEAVAGVSMLAYLDEAGSLTEMALASGDVFSFYVFADIQGHHHTSAAQFALSIPNGVTVIGEEKFSPQALTVGKLTDLFAMAYECHESGRFMLMKLACRVGDEFVGGQMGLRSGVDAQGTAFLGYATCGEGPAQKLPASGGAVTLTKK